MICPRGGMTSYSHKGKRWKKTAGNLLFFNRMVQGAKALQFPHPRRGRGVIRLATSILYPRKRNPTPRDHTLQCSDALDGTRPKGSGSRNRRLHPVFSNPRGNSVPCESPSWDASISITRDLTCSSTLVRASPRTWLKQAPPSKSSVPIVAVQPGNSRHKSTARGSIMLSLFAGRFRDTPKVNCCGTRMCLFIRRAPRGIPLAVLEAIAHGAPWPPDSKYQHGRGSRRGRRGMEYQCLGRGDCGGGFGPFFVCPKTLCFRRAGTPESSLKTPFPGPKSRNAP